MRKKGRWVVTRRWRDADEISSFRFRGDVRFVKRHMHGGILLFHFPKLSEAFFVLWVVH